MITPDNPYYRQVRLLVAVLPFVGQERCFALKGGTAINLFVRDMPRLSVDIDLAYLPDGDRKQALRAIDAALGRIGAGLEGVSPAYAVRVAKREDGFAYALLVREGEATIKIEVSPVLRGTVFPPRDLRVVRSAEEEFGFAEVQTLSFEDLFAGKLVAALDRQHPRDLFDVKLLLEREGVSENLFRAFLVYLISHDGSLARVIAPRPKALAKLFERQFADMTTEPVTLEALEIARENMIAALHRHLGEREKEFLLSFKRAAPRWELLGVERASDLPAVRWKLRNLQGMERKARDKAVRELERVLAQIGQPGRMSTP
jgi:predicted nucleotidyltransferase component of viral defense system